MVQALSHAPSGTSVGLPVELRFSERRYKLASLSISPGQFIQDGL
ncbi:MAG TPA: hypothetical protein VFP71_07985 [Candidatus Angelobacter sp.]|nr:hypothetical protein [Candidatus Angelobacter sp.]